MKNEPPANPPAEVEGKIVPAHRSGISWAWLFPLLALLATSWLFWNNWKSKGPEIIIHFETAPGIEPGKTALIYRGVKAGTVSDVHLDSTLDTVAVSLTLKAFAAELAREGTDFWIEQPVISLREIAGLESIIQGNSIHARTHGGTREAKEFHGLPDAPLTPLDSADLALKLRAPSIPFLGRATPVFHRGVNVGWVRAKTFDSDGQPEVEVIIAEQFAGKVRSNSRFWILSATAVSASPGALRLDIPSLEGLLDGSITFDHFGPEGTEVKSGTEFDLSPNETAARAEGPRLTIAFEDGAGVRAGVTRITCLGQPVGLVERVTTDPVGRKVEVVARLDAEFSTMASEDSTFTITRPSVSTTGIKGLDTLVTGPTIAFQPGQSEVLTTTFVGREMPQINWDPAVEDEDGTRVTLWAKSPLQLAAGAPIYYRGMIAGSVIEQRLGPEEGSELIISIDRTFRDLLRVNTRFWRVPAAALAVGPGVLGVQVQGLSSLLQGGVAFDSFGTPGPAAQGTARYELHTSERSASAVSDSIRIDFDNGQGLLAGQTELRYLGIPVGIVEAVRVIQHKVEATVRFQPGYDVLRRTGSEFSIVRPEIDLKGVHGIETLLSGVYISCAPGSGPGYAASFNAVPPAATALLNEPGLEILIESPSTKIDAGAPVSYNNTPVGEVIAKTLSEDGKQIILTARIRDEHKSLVRSNSVFWDDTTVQAKIGFLKVQIDTPSVLDPSGRIAFHTPDTDGEPVEKGTVFQLQSKPPRKR